MRTLLVFTYVTPGFAMDMAIVLARHLRHLEGRGWRIVVAQIDSGARWEEMPAGWQRMPLPNRRWYWPPCRMTQLAWKVRVHLLVRECEQKLARNRPDAILALQGKLEASVAAECSRRWSVPLSVIVHDLEEEWTDTPGKRDFIRARAAEVLQQASRIWPVTTEQITGYPAVANSPKVSRLFPVGDGGVGRQGRWKDEFAAAPVLVHAGIAPRYQAANFALLAQELGRIGGKLVVFAPQRHLDALSPTLAKYENIQLRPPLPTPSDVMNYIVDHASAVLVSYAFDFEQQAWARHSFPSKLVEYVHLGIPVLVLAPEEAAAARWFREQRWIGYVASQNETEISAVLDKLRRRDTWERMAEQSRAAADGPFSPDRINDQFEKELAVVSRQPGTNALRN